MSAVSIFDIFKIGIGPSSSHTVGPMLAAKHFVSSLVPDNLSSLTSIKVDLFGSLSLTGKGHGTDRAIICGLEGYAPENVSTETITSAIDRVEKQGYLLLNQIQKVSTIISNLIEFHSTSLPLHPNGMRITAQISAGQMHEISATYYSVGGGFISDEAGRPISFSKPLAENLPFEFTTAHWLIELCSANNKSIAQLVFENEKTSRSEQEINQQIAQIWQTMDQSINKGCITSGILPGGLKVHRRAARMYSKLNSGDSVSLLKQLDFLSCYALAVNEENAAFGRVVTAPTNGAAGIIPAVFKFYLTHLAGDASKINDYLLTATAIAALFKSGASLSAAEMGCQGEIGVAASMAAAAFTAIQGGTVMQVENAAEIAIEHSLGLTCDPIAGLVQIPCIERNAIGAAKAISAAQLALKADGIHLVSLDQAISAMKKTGNDMHAKYKETSTGGLAVSVAASEC